MNGDAMPAESTGDVVVGIGGLHGASDFALEAGALPAPDTVSTPVGGNRYLRWITRLAPGWRQRRAKTTDAQFQTACAVARGQLVHALAAADPHVLVVLDDRNGGFGDGNTTMPQISIGPSFESNPTYLAPRAASLTARQKAAMSLACEIVDAVDGVPSVAALVTCPMARSTATAVDARDGPVPAMQGIEDGARPSILFVGCRGMDLPTCHAVGQAIRRAARSSPYRVGVVSSGRLRGPTPDMGQVAALIAACRHGDVAALGRIDLAPLPREAADDFSAWAVLAGTSDHLELDWIRHLTRGEGESGRDAGAFALWA